MKAWWEAGGQGLRPCLCGLLSGLIGNRCGEGRRPGSQPEQLGEIKNNSIPGDWGNYSGREGGSEGGRDVRSERQRESFRAMWSLTRVSVEYERLNRQEGFKGTVLQRLAKANKLQLYFQWKHDHTRAHTSHMHTCTHTHSNACIQCTDLNASEWPSNGLSLHDSLNLRTSLCLFLRALVKAYVLKSVMRPQNGACTVCVQLYST